MSKPLILFVHGLGGDPLATWGQFGALIAKDPDLGNRVDTAFFAYPTSLLNWRPWRRSLRVQDIALALKTELDVLHASRDQILLVCHSLGGLVAKHYICNTLKQQDSLRIRGVVFFATPHSGAALASAPSVFSWNHFHLRQLRPDSDFIDLLADDWVRLRCESVLRTKYVAGGQDSIVSRSSASPPNTSAELVLYKNHRTIVKPEGYSDLSYLILKQATSWLFSSDRGDLAQARAAIAARDDHLLASIVSNRGRSWIETTEADAAVEVLRDIANAFDPTSPAVIWSRYLIALSRLFRYQDTSSTAFSDELLVHADAIGLAPLFLGERMEFARKRGNRAEVLTSATTLLNKIRGIDTSISPGSAYALGTAHFLLGNLYRYGGQYKEASTSIAKASTFYRPTILSHQIELTHCYYASAVCRAMEGSLIGDDALPPTVGREFRRFADALVTLSQSHSAWSKDRLDEAMDFADRASESFDQINFTEYSRRARSLAELLGAWRRLELGAASDTAIAHTPAHATIIRGMTGEPEARGALKDWIYKTRPSRVLGMLQFASAYSQDWTRDIGQFRLPPTLRINDGNIRWHDEESFSLQDADAKLRGLMGIGARVPVPLLAD